MKKYKVLLSLFCIVVFVFLAVGSTGNDEESVDEPEETEDKVIMEEKPPEERDATIIYEIIGETVRLGDDDTIDEITYSNDSIFLSLNAGEHLTLEAARFFMLRESKDIFEVMLDKYYDEVYIVWHYPNYDTYGHKKMVKVMEIAMDKETGEKINWSGVRAENILELAVEYWEDPDFN